ncbi:MAG: DegV family protein [Halanaerobacter sp.]
MKINYLNGKKIYYAVLSGAKRVIKNRKLLNEINVFPIPDGDTGSNLASMMKLIMQQVKPKDSSKEMMESIADAALEGARGNSGIIFAQFLTALAQEVEDELELSPKSFVNSVNRAVPYLYEAVAEPVEGTMITVIHDWADSLALEEEKGIDFIELLSSSLIAAQKSLEQTTTKLKALEKAEVVDAGAKGFVKFLEGMVDFMQGKEIKDFKKGELLAAQEEMAALEDEHRADEFRYCTEVFLAELIVKPQELKDNLSSYGDSLVTAGTKKQARIHLHTNQPAEVVHELREWGVITRQKVDDMFKEAAVAHNQKYPIALVTDSIADLPQEVIDSYQIQVIPLNLMLGDNNYLDKVTITADKFYSLLQESEELASSSQPSYRDVDNLFSFLSSHYQSILVITVAEQLSGTWNLINSAAGEYEEEGVAIEVIDSKLNSGAQGLVVLEAAERIAAGQSFDEVRAEVQKIITRTEIYVSVETVEYMVKGGRISRPKGWLAKLLNLKPIISLDEDGAGIAFDKAFSSGGLKKKIKGLVADIVEQEGVKRYAVVHAQAREEAEDYAQRLEDLIGDPPEYIMEISPVVGLNSGPGSIAVALIKGG